MKALQRKFRARLEKGDPALGWTVVRVPFSAAEVWEQRLRLRVRGTINGWSFRTSLLPDSVLGGQVLLVNRAMQKGAGAGLGDEAEVLLEPDLEPRPVLLTEELDAVLDEAEGLRDFYDGLSESMRREIGKWIEEAKSDSVRQKRAAQMAERLLSTLDAEAELPPAIQAAFRQNEAAKKGWLLLTPAQRRRELFAVFSYQTPESRSKRIGKLCALAASKTAAAN
ncbi:MAG: YdeI/OmpD-associated family protein [Acidobacteriaceae bacterium]|nr:YdeI/OmpD-associated family protein [Acidobacteriaceae bacterium]